jgi:adenine phosphoribosyltransferase
MLLEEKLKHTIRDVADYPKPGILFKDITPVLANPDLVHDIVEAMAKQVEGMPIDAIAGVESRGFIFGSLLAHRLRCKFLLVRKSGKLPYKTYSQEYALEYGTAAVEIHVDAVTSGSRVLIHDDLLATGGTATAAAQLVQRAGGTVAGFSFLVNLSFLPGEKKLTDAFGIKPSYLVSF